MEVLLPAYAQSVHSELDGRNEGMITILRLHPSVSIHLFSSVHASAPIALSFSSDRALRPANSEDQAAPHICDQSGLTKLP